MNYILCYGDSNTWGSSPDQLPRYGFYERWPGIMQRLLGESVHVYENGLYGRTTGFQDDVEEGRNGKVGFRQVMEMCAPLDAVILMLGSNDCKMRFSTHPAWDSALNMRQLAREAKQVCYGNNGKTPQILLIAPPMMGHDWEHSWVGGEFNWNSTEKSEELAALYKKVAMEDGLWFLDASKCAKVGADCVHMTKKSHQSLGEQCAEWIKTSGVLTE